MGSLSARLLAVVVLVFPHAGIAQSDDRERAAEAEFRAGVEASTRDAWSEAIDHFETSLSLYPRVAAAFDLVVAYGRVDDPGGLLRAHDGFVRLADPERHADLLDRLRPMVERALARVARVRLVLEPRGAEVFVDGAAVERLVYLSPGRHRVRASASGHEDHEADIETRAGEQHTLTVSLVPSAPSELLPASPFATGFARGPEPSMLRADTSRRDHPGSLAIATWCSAAVLWVGAGVLHGWAMSEADALASADPSQTGFLSATRRYADLRTSGALVSTGAAAVTLASLVPWAAQVAESPPWWMTVLGGLVAAAGLGLVIRPPERLADTRLTDPFRTVGASVLNLGLAVGLAPVMLWIGGELP